MNYYENTLTGEVLATTADQFKLGFFNPNQWDQISEERYNQILALSEKRYHAVRNSLGGYCVIPTDNYNDQGDIIFTGNEDLCWEAIEKDKEQ